MKVVSALFVILLVALMACVRAGDISCPNYDDYHLVGRMRKGSNFTSAIPDVGFALAQSVGYSVAQSQALFDRGLAFFVSEWGVALNTDFVPIAANQYCKFNLTTQAPIACIFPEAFISNDYVVVTSDLDLRKPSRRECIINYSVGPVLLALQDFVLNGKQFFAFNFVTLKQSLLVSKVGSQTVRVPLEFKTVVPARITPELNIIELAKANMTLNGQVYRGDIIINVALTPTFQTSEVNYVAFLKEQQN